MISFRRPTISEPRAYEEIIDFIAAGTSPQKAITLCSSEEAWQRVWDLVACEKTDGLSREETAELDYYLQLEHIMGLGKTPVQRYVYSGSS
jgi:hypothetical protein